MKDVLDELRSRRRQNPFVPFIIVLQDGRRFPVNRRLQYAFTEDRVVVLDERDLTDFFRPSEIAELETTSNVA